MDCLGCTERISDQALLECGHSSVCPTCIFRLRILLKDIRCPECRHPSEVVFIAHDGTYEGYASTLWGDRSMNGFVEYERSKIYCQTEELKQEFSSMTQHRCQICSQTFKGKNQLQVHLDQTHKLIMCDLCLEHKAVFICEQELFSPEELKQHKEDGDLESGSPGHPKCRLCSRFVYDDRALLQHIRDQHYFCDLCPAGSRPAFADYQTLERHYDKHHFLCGVASCKKAKHVVFSTWDELGSHHRTYHRGVELPVLKPSFIGAGEEYIPRVTEAPVKRPGIGLSEEQKNEEFPALCAVAAQHGGAWGETDSPLKKLVKPKVRVAPKEKPHALPVRNPLTFEQMQHKVSKPQHEEVKTRHVSESHAQAKSKQVYTPKDFPSLGLQETVPKAKFEVTVEGQVALVNRGQLSKDGFIAWFIDSIPKDQCRDNFQAIYAGLKDRRFAESIVSGIEGRAKQSEKAVWDSDFPALMTASAPHLKPAKKAKEKKAKPAPASQGSPWFDSTAQRPHSASPVPKTVQPSVSTQPEHFRIVQDNLSLLSAGDISPDEFIQAYLLVVPHTEQLSNQMLALVKGAGREDIVIQLWGRVDKSLPARGAVLDAYKSEIDSNLHMYRYKFITKEQFVEAYTTLVPQAEWLNRELIRYIEVSVPSQRIIEGIEQKARQMSKSFSTSEYPSLAGGQTKNSKKK